MRNSKAIKESQNLTDRFISEVRETASESARFLWGALLDKTGDVDSLRGVEGGVR